MHFNWSEFVGFAGDGLIIITYILLQLEKIRSENPIFSLLNALGASLIIVSLVFKFNLSAFIVEFFWVLVSLYGIGKYFLSDAHRERTRKSKTSGR